MQQDCSEIPQTWNRGFAEFFTSKFPLPLPHPVLDLSSILVASKKQLLSVLLEAESNEGVNIEVWHLVRPQNGPFICKFVLVLKYISTATKRLTKAKS